MKAKLVIIGCLFLCTALLAPLLRLTQYERVPSADGQFYAVASFRVWRSFVSMAPGSGGDKPGYVTVFTKDGESCGAASVPMVSMIGQITWNATYAELPLIAEWDLASHTVQRY